MSYGPFLCTTVCVLHSLTVTLNHFYAARVYHRPQKRLAKIVYFKL